MDTNIKGFSLDVNVSAKSHGGLFWEAELYRCYALVSYNLLLVRVAKKVFHQFQSLTEANKWVLQYLVLKSVCL